MDTDPNQSAPLVTVTDIDEIKTQEVKYVVADNRLLRNQLYKKIAFIVLLFLIIAAPTLFFVSRPHKTLVYEKYEEFGPCLTDKATCYQKTSLYASGELDFQGKTAKKSQVSSKTVQQVKSAIRSSNIMKQPCQEDQIVMEYKLTHTFLIDGAKKEIQSPACDAEMDQLDSALDQLLK